MLECHKDVSYALDEDGYAESEYNDLVRKRFMRAWETMTQSYRVSLSPLLYCHGLNLSAGNDDGIQLSHPLWLDLEWSRSTVGSHYPWDEVYRGQFSRSKWSRVKVSDKQAFLAWRFEI